MKKFIGILIFFISFNISSQDTYLQCGKIIDTERGKVLNKKTIIVSSDKIIAIKNGYVPSDNPLDKVIDLKSKTVMPGLSDETYPFFIAIILSEETIIVFLFKTLPLSVSIIFPHCK